MQNKNLILFILLSFLFMVGWSQLVQWLSPPRVRKVQIESAEALRGLDAGLWIRLQAASQRAAIQAVSLPGVGAVLPLATDLALVDWSHEQEILARKKAEPPPAHEEPVIERPARKVEHRVTELGDESENSRFNLKVALTSTGGAVQEVILNKFAQANRLGRPAEPPQRLHLVPEDPHAPSNLLYHYTPPVEGEQARPPDTLGMQEWTLQSVKNGPDHDVHEAVFTTTVPKLDVTITKTYTLAPGTYHVGLTVRLERNKANPKPLLFRYQLTGAHGLPIEGEWYTTVFRNAMIGIDTRHSVRRSLQDARSIGFRGGGDELRRGKDSFIRYAAIATQFFASAVVVDDDQEAGVGQDFIAWARPTVEGEPDPRKQQLDDITVRLISEPVELKPGVPVTHKYLLYNGPVKVRLLGHLEGERAVNEKLVERYETKLGLNTMTDTGSVPMWSDLLITCTNVMHGLLYYLHYYLHFILPFPWIYGLCIILLTVMVRGTMFPLSRRQALATAKFQAQMAELAPEFKKLEEKHKNDRLALQQAKHELMSKRGINQFAMLGSCWMVFAQMPIFLGLYYALQESIHFRLAPFLWMKNLAAPDMLFYWSENIPIISRPDDQGGFLSFLYLGPFFNLLPIIAVTLMIIQQKLLTPPPTDEQQEMQQKMMKYMMVFFGLMFYKVAAGLCIYFIASSLWGVAERTLLLPKRQTAGMPPVPSSGKGGGTARSPARQKARGPKPNGDGAVQKVRDWWNDVLKEARKR
jgi:YidC/Oxa1 family membrane protein insertase